MILIDSSVWIEYFKGNAKAVPLNSLIDMNAICTNDLILSEILPAIIQKKENNLRDLLLEVEKIPLEIVWNRIIQMQILNLKNGINKVGISDLIIAQNAIENDIKIFTFDKHFELMSDLHGIKLFK